MTPARRWWPISKKQTGEIDAARKKARDTLDALRDEVRKPLTDWEAEQERIEQERKDAEERARAEAEAARLAAEIARKEERSAPASCARSRGS